MLDRIKELVDILNKAAKAYYQESTEIMSNYEYDKLALNKGPSLLLYE